MPGFGGARARRAARDDAQRPRLEAGWEDGQQEAPATVLNAAMDGQPRHPPTLGGQRVTGTGHLLFLHKQLLTRCLLLLRQYDRGCLHCEMSTFRFRSKLMSFWPCRSCTVFLPLLVT